MKIFEREAFFIRKEHFDTDALQAAEKAYTFRFYNEKACETCEYLPDRHYEGVCDNCAAYEGGAKLSNIVKMGGKEYVKFPAGDKVGLLKLLRGLEITNFDHLPQFQDLRLPVEQVAFKKPIRFLTKLYPFQEEATKRLVECKRGILKSPPRTGKTIMGTWLACQLGIKTIIIAAQVEWLKGFYETFCGSDTQPPMTDATGSGLTAVERRNYFKKHTHAGVGFCKTLEDFQRHDVCLVTIQSLYSAAGKALMASLRDIFGLLMIDEVHTNAAPEFAKATSKFNVRYAFGFSGTPDRKDLRETLTYKLIGPIVHEVKVERLKPTVRLVKTAYADKRKEVDWVRTVTALENNKDRLKLIAKWAIQDAAQGHMVLIPLNRISAVKTLVDLINKLAGEQLAYAFYGAVKDSDREQLIQDARTYKAKILVGNTKLVSVGVNIPRASCLYDVALSSNLQNCEQRTSRVLTAYDGKPPPLIRYFLDDMPVRRACLRNEWWQCVHKIFKPSISETDEEILKRYLAGKDIVDKKFDADL
jgi:superfamily II DNA or RNA helicase